MTKASKDDYIRFRLTNQTKKSIESAALIHCDGNVSQYLIELHEKNKGKPAATIPKELKEQNNLLSRIGNNLNQISYNINTLTKADKGISEHKAKEIMKELHFISATLSSIK